MFLHTPICVLILLYMCPRTTIYVSSYRHARWSVRGSYESSWRSASSSCSQCCSRSRSCGQRYAVDLLYWYKRTNTGGARAAVAVSVAAGAGAAGKGIAICICICICIHTRICMYVCIYMYVCIICRYLHTDQHTSAFVCIRVLTCGHPAKLEERSASMLTSAYVSTRQHTSAYVC
jgi:hypothetical protein